MTEPLRAFLETTDDSFLRGWAFDPNQPDRRVTMEFRLSSGDAAVVCADQYREDLPKELGGDGRQAFNVRLPPSAYSGHVSLVAHEAETGRRIPEISGRIKPSALGLVAGDIVDNCNLRCPFCMVDYSRIRGLRQMTRETFGRLIGLMPAIADGSAWLSCLHEPTLNAGLGEMLRMVPENLRRKVSFTTNLCKKLDDETLRTMAESGLHHIRISYDTDDAALFALLRRGGTYANFRDNLRRLAGFIQAAAAPTQLAFVTMAFQDNHRQLAAFIRACAEQHRPLYHEVRYMYYSPHLLEWGREHILSREEWAGLEAELKALPPPASLITNGPIEGTFEQFEKGEGAEAYQSPGVTIGDAYGQDAPEAPDPFQAGLRRPNRPLELRLRWDGLMVLDEKPLANLHQLSDPIGYFQALRSSCAPDPDGLWRKS